MVEAYVHHNGDAKFVGLIHKCPQVVRRAVSRMNLDQKKKIVRRAVSLINQGLTKILKKSVP